MLRHLATMNEPDLVMDQNPRFEQEAVRRALRRRQGSASDRSFAIQCLGTSPSHYNHWLHGQGRLGLDLLVTATMLWPEVADAVREDLLRSAERLREQHQDQVHSA